MLLADWTDVIVHYGALAGALGAIGFVVAFLYRRTGLRTMWRWFTRHIREDRTAERVTELKAVLDVTVVPEIRAVSDRLDSHMDTEEGSISQITENLAAIRHNVAEHMDSDTRQFEESKLALIAGQDRLDKKLDSIDGKLGRIRERIVRLERRR